MLGKEPAVLEPEAWAFGLGTGQMSIPPSSLRGPGYQPAVLRGSPGSRKLVSKVEEEPGPRQGGSSGDGVLGSEKGNQKFGLLS